MWHEHFLQKLKDGEGWWQNSGLFLFFEISSASYIGNTVNIFSSYIF